MSNKKHPVKKWAEDLNRHFSKDDTQMPKKKERKKEKKVFNIANYKMQIKTTKTHHCTPFRLAIIKSL